VLYRFLVVLVLVAAFFAQAAPASAAPTVDYLNAQLPQVRYDPNGSGNLVLYAKADVGVSEGCTVDLLIKIQRRNVDGLWTEWAEYDNTPYWMSAEYFYYTEVWRYPVTSGAFRTKVKAVCNGIGYLDYSGIKYV
jgi:hypothetical protein